MSDETQGRIRDLVANPSCEPEVRVVLESLIALDRRFQAALLAQKSGQGLGGGLPWNGDALIELIDADEALERAMVSYRDDASHGARAELLALVARSAALRSRYCPR